MRSYLKKQARGVEITQILCENLAKELQNFRNLGALRRKNCVYSASVRCEKYRNVAAAVGEVGRLFRSEKGAPGVEITQNLRKKFAKELQNFRNFGMPLAALN